MNGILNLNKPAGISSAAAVGKVKRLLPRGTKIGHAGTLDPFATGVLLLLVGRATKLCEKLMDEPKQYEATVKLGATTETLDPTSQEIVDAGAKPAGSAELEAALKKFVGEIQQRPPIYSALKIDGRTAYARARAGEAVELEPRAVRVYGIELLRHEWPMLDIRVDCGRGTYIRSLARDIGEALGTKGYLTALKRSAVGRFKIEDAVTIEQLRSQDLAPFLCESPGKA
jgi:tRNA pseudouridine55 synthase